MNVTGIAARLKALNARLSLLSYEIIAATISLPQTLYALRTGRECLRLYRGVALAHPQMPARERYRQVVMARGGLPEDEAEAALCKAEQSFATWPRPRPLKLADVAHYLAVSEYLARRPGYGTKVNMGLLIAGRVPADL
jgi:hypothetical protein